jgi:quaternary ammonium compound-resistance protein SugE
MDWVLLIGSGVLEAVWATALGASDGLRRRRPALVFLVATVLSVWGLAVAMETIPTGTAYAVWTATGASLTVVWAMVRGTEPVALLRILLLVGIVSCVVGLKVVS